MSKDKPDLEITTQSKIAQENSITETSEKKIINLNHGALGYIFGGSESAPTNICGLTLTLLIIIGIIFCFTNSKIEALEYWKTMAMPLITLILGYLFGQKPK